MHRCPTCNHRHKNNSCSQCRTNLQAQALGRRVDRCGCGILAPLHSNNECRRCLDRKSLKECRTCERVLDSVKDFYTQRAVCKTCSTSPANPRFSKYGITQEIFEEYVSLQNGQCWICGTSTKLVVDHDHATGRFRGAICNKCNVGIGYFKDSIRHLHKAIDYLQTTNTQDVHEPLKRLQPEETQKWAEIERELQGVRATCEKLQATTRQLQPVVEWMRCMQVFLRHPGPENPEIRLGLATDIQKRIDEIVLLGVDIPK